MSEKTVTISFGELLDSIGGFGKNVPAAIEVAVRASIEAMIRDAVVNRMHNRGKYIGVVTGAGVRSVTGSGKVKREGVRILGSFGSSLVYIRAHEEGFKGSVTVKPHTRRIARRSGRSLGQRAARTGGRTTAYVRAHQRLMNIRAKHFLADSLSAGRPGVERRAVAALLYLARTGKVPTLRDVTGGGGA